MLLIHGLCGTPAEMRFIAMGLARAGYTVHCPLLAGHGGSREEVVKTGWRDWYRGVEEALDEIRKECDTVIVGGLCLGGILGLHLAINHPEKVQGLALFAPRCGSTAGRCPGTRSCSISSASAGWRT